MDKKSFFDEYRKVFGKLNQSQVNGIDKLLSFLEVESKDNMPNTFMAYMLATVKHECADKWIPITEYGKREYFNKYEPDTNIGKRLGNVVQGDGYCFRGRGYVQITGRENYQKFNDLLRVDLMSYPDFALLPHIAYKIMRHGMIRGLFTGKKLSDYFNDRGVDFYNARRIINGMDQAKKIGEYAMIFNNILEVSR